VQWKEFIVEYDILKKKKNIGNTKKIVVDFEERVSIEVRR